MVSTRGGSNIASTFTTLDMASSFDDLQKQISRHGDNQLQSNIPDTVEMLDASVGSTGLFHLDKNIQRFLRLQLV